MYLGAYLLRSFSMPSSASSLAASCIRIRKSLSLSPGLEYWSRLGAPQQLELLAPEEPVGEVLLPGGIVLGNWSGRRKLSSIWQAPQAGSTNRALPDLYFLAASQSTGTGSSVIGARKSSSLVTSTFFFTSENRTWDIPSSIGR